MLTSKLSHFMSLICWFARQMWQESCWCALLTSLPSASSNTLCRCSKAFDQEVWINTVYMRATSPCHPPPLASICTPVMSALFRCETQPKWIQHWQRCGSVSLVCPPPLCSCRHLSFRNSATSPSSRHISLLPFVTWHCWPDSPSARMVSTTVSNSFFLLLIHLYFLWAS